MVTTLSIQQADLIENEQSLQGINKAGIP